MQAQLAIDLGGTKCAGAIIFESNLVLRDKVIVSGLEGDAVFDKLLKLVLSLSEKAGSEDITITGIGVSVPGISNADGTVWAPNIPGWDQYPLKVRLEESTGKPVTIASDRECAIVGEVLAGNARNIRDAIYVAVGTGIGAGIMTDGKVLTGANNIAGAIGWLALDGEFREEYEVYGNFEYHASGDGLARFAKDLLHAGNPNTPLSVESGAEDILKYYDQGDTLASLVVKNAIRYWGRAVANLISIFNPEVIIFGGGLFGPASKFIPEISKEAKKWAQPIAFRRCSILPSALGNDALLFGAAKLAK